MKVLVACEYSGIVRDAFLSRGHDAISCDLLPTESEGPHIQGDVLPLLQQPWDLVVAHPPCTYLTNSGVCWLHKKPGRWELLDDAAAFYKAMLSANSPRIAIENPIFHKYAVDRIGGNHTQIIQPWQFGHKEMKAIGLRLVGLPKLQPTDVVGPPPKDKSERKKWQPKHYLPPSPDRAKLRSRFFEGVATAMASQWGNLV